MASPCGTLNSPGPDPCLPQALMNFPFLENLAMRSLVLSPWPSATKMSPLGATRMSDGSLKVSKVGDKVFMGRDIIHVAIWPREGDANFYTMIYQDGETGKAFAKRFQIGADFGNSIVAMALSRDLPYPTAP